MSHISSIGASMFSDMSICTDATLGNAAIADPTEVKLKASFAAAKYSRVKNVREFPSMGTPANVVSVPVYGQKTSSQIQGQADAPSIELTINYVAADWAPNTVLGGMVGDQTQRVFRFTLLNEAPNGYDSSAATVAPSVSIAGSTTNPVENSSYYFVGKLEAILVNPQLSDATTATVTITTQSDFFGPFTV